MPRNQRLQAAVDRAQVTVDDIAKVCGVDMKTVYRWIHDGRVPHKRHRWAAAKLLRDDAEYLWPESMSVISNGGGDEIVAAYAYRADVPTAVWWEVFSRAGERIDLLGYTLYFLSLQHPDLVSAMQAKCEAGTQIRAIVADPESEHVAYRDREEGTPLTLAVRIKTTLDAWRPLLSAQGFQLRCQDAPLYNSVFRFDDHMFVTPHLYATPGSQAPLMHLRKVGSGGLFSRFADHFEAIWNAGAPYAAKE
ncbi:MAG: helix-turn-helix domain-containing protein [Stackebrandtia sp.]